MFKHAPFYWQHFKKYVSIMGTMLNDISIVRESNGKQKLIKVPISFAQKDKQLEYFRQNPELNNSWKTVLPRIGFEMGSPTYAPERKDNTNNMWYLDDNGTKRKMQLPPAPYDIPFTAYIWVPYYEDGLQIIEQILPFFQPEYYVNVREIPELGLNRDVSISLLSVTSNDSWDGVFEDARVIEWQLEFNLRGWFYGPVQDRSVIKKTYVDFFTDFELDVPIVEITQRVDPLEADRDDPHTIIEEIKENYE